MEAGAQSGAATSGSGGGPAPFLLKTYEMVDDSSTDEIVSWSSTKNSFIVWNHPEFSRLLLPTYFKHNNFSSFIRQLNTYGFRKIDPERWEFANEDFVKDQKHLLKNIHRRKPIHSHSQPHSSFGEAERAALEEEIEKLSQEKSALQSELLRFQQQQSSTKAKVEVLEKRVYEMQQRQYRMISFIAKAVKNPTFVDHLIQMSGSFVDFSAINKKRRLPKIDFCQEIVENSFVDNQGGGKSDYRQIFHQDFSDKLTLELSPALSDNLVSASVHSSTEDGGSPQKKPVEVDMMERDTRTECLSFAPEVLELSDTGASFSTKTNGFSRHMGTCDSIEEGEGHIPCHLNLTLASSSLQEVRVTQPSGEECGTSLELRSNLNAAENPRMGKTRGHSEDDKIMSPSHIGPIDSNNNQGPPATQGRVNDVFWEQFLTERPGSSDTEEASSSFRASPCDEQDERKPRSGKFWRNKKDMEQLTL